MTYNKNNKLRLFEICAGYGSQALALNRLREIYPDFDYELVGWAEFDPEPDANPDIDKQPAVIAHNALHSDGIGKNWGDITKIMLRLERQFTIWYRRTKRIVFLRRLRLSRSGNIGKHVRLHPYIVTPAIHPFLVI